MRSRAPASACYVHRGDFAFIPARYRPVFTPGIGLLEGEGGGGGAGAGDGGGGTKTYTQAEVDAQLSGLRSKNDELLGSQKQLKEKLKSFEGIEADPETIRTALKERETTEETRRKAEGDFTTWRADIQKKHVDELTKRDGELSRVKSALEKRLVDGALVKAIADAGGNDELLVPALRSQVRMVEVDGDFVARVVDVKGTPRLKDAQNFMSIDDLVSETKAKPKFGVAFGAPAAAGGGAAGSGDGGATAGGGTGNVLYISPEDANDTQKFRSARAQAAKEHKQLVIGRPGQ